MGNRPKRFGKWGEKVAGISILMLCIGGLAIVLGKWLWDLVKHVGTDPTPVRPMLADETWTIWFLPTLWMLVLLPWFLLVLFGWALARGKKRTILYLRRFGFTSANQVISRAMEGQFRSRYRVITLDDSAFAPQHAAKAMTLTIAIMIPVLIFFIFSMMIIGIILILWKFPPSTKQMFWVYATSAIAYFSWPTIAGLLWWACFVAATLLTLGWRRRRTARFRIQNLDDIPRCVLRAHQLAGWLRASRLMAPAATVVTTPDTIWQPAVLAFAEHTHALVFDISVLSPGVLWEMEQLGSQSLTHVVFVAHEGQFKEWTEKPTHEVTIAKIKAKLSATTILRYRDQMSALERRQFYRALKKQVESAACSRHELAPIPTPETRSLMLGILRWITAYAAVCMLATVLSVPIVRAIQRLFG